jgi:hypothetical protein
MNVMHDKILRIGLETTRANWIIDEFVLGSEVRIQWGPWMGPKSGLLQLRFSLYRRSTASAKSVGGYVVEGPAVFAWNLDYLFLNGYFLPNYPRCSEARRT